MRCSLFTATSVDEIINKEDGTVDLSSASCESHIGLGEHLDIIFRACFYSIDCMNIGGN